MTETRIRPEEVSATDAARVLRFLNAAHTAAEIAEAVEISGELDIGLAIAQRILNARDELGGAFTSLQQVAAVKYVGPERFTELVLALTGQVEPPVSALYEQLRAEVAALRAAVRTLEAGGGARYRVTLRPAPANAYLGQPVTILTRVTDAAGRRPLINQPVQLATTWGKLQFASENHVELGSSISARTGIDGTVRVTLLPPTSEVITGVQQAALEAMLSLLDTEAETPTVAGPGLQELARHYDWATNIQFRRATDIYLHDFRPKLLDTLNERNYMQVWSYFESLVVAYAQEPASDDGVSTPVEGSAVLSVRLRDWLGPFLQTYTRRSKELNGLGSALTHVVQGGGAATDLLTGIYGQVNSFVGSRYGAIGQYVGRKVAADTLREFLDTGLAELPLDLRHTLSPALQKASNTIKASSATILANLGQTQAAVGAQIKAMDQTTQTYLVEELGKVQTQMGALGANVNALFDASTATPVVPINVIVPPIGPSPIIIGGLVFKPRGGLFEPPLVLP